MSNAAKDIQTRAADWLMERHEAGSWNAHSQAELDAWLAQSPAHRVAYIKLETAWGRTHRLAAMRAPAGEETQKTKKRQSISTAIKALAMLAFAGVFGAVAADYLLASHELMFATTTGGHKTVRLADGTQIELNTDTLVRATLGDTRTVWLDRGEAYFQVKHDPARPFVVIAGDRRVTDLGTKFLARRDPDRLEVDVIQGRVRFETTVNDGTKIRSALLLPGNVAVATGQSLFVTRQPEQALANRLSWRRGVLIFDHTTMAAAVADFNRYNREKLIVADTSAARMKIDGTFPANDVELFARVARDILGLHIENRENEIVIAR